MSFPKQFESFVWNLAVIFASIVGVWFILWSGLVGLFGKVNVNGQEITFAAEPLKFVAVILGVLAIALTCIAFGVVRFALSRQRG